MNSKPSQREHIPGLDLVRFAACLGIVLYHFACSSDCALFKRIFLNYANGDWGNALVALFFMLSGALLFYHYNVELDVPKFYRKRFRTIYPEFWLAYALCFALKALRAGTVFFKGPPTTLPLSVLGVDGYLLDWFPNYYIIGEWFLGAIIMIYLLYPALCRAFRRAPLLLTGALLAACLVCDRVRLFPIAPNRNLFVCAFEFELGMLLIRYRAALRKPRWTYLCLLAEVALLALRLPRPLFSQQYTILHALALYVLLERLGAWISGRFARAFRLIQRGAEVSYPVFLLHNFILHNALDLRNPAGAAGAAAMLLIVLLLIFAAASLLHALVARLLRRKARA